MKKILIPAAALIALAGGTALVAQMPTAAPGTKDADPDVSEPRWEERDILTKGHELDRAKRAQPTKC